jgi:hypothetical protein
VTLAEAEVMRASFVEGLKAGSGHAPRRSKFARWGLLSALVATAAFAQLIVFQADTPALASAVNANFTQLKTWLEAKVGSVSNSGVATTTVSATTSVSTPTLTVTTSVTAPTVTATTQTVSGTLTAKTVQVNEDLTVSRNLTVSGTGGNTLHACNVRGVNNQYVAACGTGEIAIGGGGFCPTPNGDSFQIVSTLPWNSAGNSVANTGAMPDSWRIVCQIWGSNGAQLPPVSSYVLCCSR